MYKPDFAENWYTCTLFHDELYHDECMCEIIDFYQNSFWYLHIYATYDF